MKHGPAIRANGKQLLLRGEHLAECRDEDVAIILATILSDSDLQRRLPEPWPPRDQVKVDAITAILAGLIGMIAGACLGAIAL